MFYTAATSHAPTAATLPDAATTAAQQQQQAQQQQHSSNQQQQQQLQLTSAGGLQTVQVPVQLQAVNQQSNYLNQALYQQWIQQQFQVQQQQQQQHVPSQGHGAQDALSFASADGTQLFTGYLDHHGQTGLDFHNLNGQDPGQTLSLSTLQTFANLHTQQGQTFMLAPSAGNSYILTNDHHTPQPAHHQLAQLPLRQHHHQHEQQQLQQQHAPHAHLQSGAPKKKGPKAAAKAAAQAAAQAAAVAASQLQTPAKGGDKVKPPKMKGTPNAYALFYKETYAKLRAENPEWKASQIMAEAGKIWKVMNGALQDKYRSQAESLVQAQQQLMHSSSKSHKKQKSAQKRPMTAYQLFIREHFSQRQADTASMHAKDFLLKLSGLWKALEPEEKKAYQDRAKAEKTRREAENANGPPLPAYVLPSLNGAALNGAMEGHGAGEGPGAPLMDLGLPLQTGAYMGDSETDEAGQDMPDDGDMPMDASGSA